MKADRIDTVDGWSMLPKAMANMSNCRLKKTRARLMRHLAMVEEEMDARLGKGGGGLT